MTGCRVIVVDDDHSVRWVIGARLREDGHRVALAANGEQALAELEEGVDLIMLDYRLPDADGVDLLAEIKRRRPNVPVIMMTGHSSVSHAVVAMKAGAWDYLAKPMELDRISEMVDRALQATRLWREARAQESNRIKDDAIGAIVGESEPMRRLKEMLPRVACSRATTVLVTGESGTGKDLAARAVHEKSERSDGPFVNITCSAIPGALLESELFGYERGAFTDAKSRKLGLFEEAAGGTVFLDEIGEMELSLQAKLLRFLESHTFRRVGGTEEITADIRVVAATNVDLREAVAARRFREDLYYRLAVVTLHVPPLRERGRDIDILVAHFVERFNVQFGKDVRRVDGDAMRLLRAHNWPGNVRELRNAVERAVLLSSHEVLTACDFELLTERRAEADEVVRLPAAGVDVRELERSLLTQALERTNGNKTRAGELLGMNRDQIRYRMRRYGIEDAS